MVYRIVSVVLIAAVLAYAIVSNNGGIGISKEETTVSAPQPSPEDDAIRSMSVGQ